MLTSTKWPKVLPTKTPGNLCRIFLARNAHAGAARTFLSASRATTCSQPYPLCRRQRDGGQGGRRRQWTVVALLRPTPPRCATGSPDGACRGYRTGIVRSSFAGSEISPRFSPVSTRGVPARLYGGQQTFFDSRYDRM